VREGRRLTTRRRTVIIDPSAEKRLRRLRAWNVGVGLILADEAVLIAVLTNTTTSSARRSASFSA
jgi:hypothetical protein